MNESLEPRKGVALRPIERRLAQWAADGVDDVEVARRFARSPDHIRRMRTMADYHRRDAQVPLQGDVLRPLERRVLRWRAAGESVEGIGRRFRRGPESIRQIEILAHYKLSER